METVIITCDMNVDELKIKALLEGLEAENIEEFMRKAKISDYRNYGKAYVSAARNKINEQKPLFITDDGVEVFDKDEYYSIGVDFKAIRMRALEHGRPYSSDVKRFKHESNADEYIWRNKRVFSYEDIYNYLKTTPLFDIERMNIVEQWIRELAKERVCNG